MNLYNYEKERIVTYRLSRKSVTLLGGPGGQPVQKAWAGIFCDPHLFFKLISVHFLCL